MGFSAARELGWNKGIKCGCFGREKVRPFGFFFVAEKKYWDMVLRQEWKYVNVEVNE